VQPTVLAGFEDSVFDNFTVMGHEAHVIHRAWADKRDLYTPYVRDRLAEAAAVTQQQYETALASGARLADSIDRLLEEFDLLLVPGVPFPASPAYDEEVLIDGTWEDRDTGLCRNTAFANLTGHPTLAVPAGLDGVLPVGVQLVGRRRNDLELIAHGARLQELLPPGLPPALFTPQTRA
jgi:Asp-tRNA(Asn)/Glu-tRNA(Gln) amidotransferase A subunit family amidase